jgi:tetratricopeptide (TPR) repeat protein
MAAAPYRDILRNKQEAVSLEQANRVVKSDDVAQNLITEYEARVMHEPRNFKLLRNLAELYTQKKQFDRALEYYERIRAEEGGADPSLEKAIADTNLKKIALLKSQLDPAAADYDQRVAELDAQKQVYQLEECRKRADKYPTDLQIRFELGQLYYEAGKIGEAIQEFQRAQNNPQRRVASVMYLGRCFAKRGMNDMAARKFQDALKEKSGSTTSAKRCSTTSAACWRRWAKRTKPSSTSNKSTSRTSATKMSRRRWMPITRRRAKPEKRN